MSDGTGSFSRRQDFERLATLEVEMKHLRADFEDLHQLVLDTRNMTRQTNDTLERFIAVAKAGGGAFSAMIRVGSLLVAIAGAVASAAWFFWKHVKITL